MFEIADWRVRVEIALVVAGFQAYRKGQNVNSRAITLVPTQIAMKSLNLFFGAIAVLLGALLMLMVVSRASMPFEARLSALENASQAQAQALQSLDGHLARLASELTDLATSISTVSRTAYVKTMTTEPASSGAEIASEDGLQSAVHRLETAMDSIENDVNNLNLAIAAANNTNNSPVLFFPMSHWRPR